MKYILFFLSLMWILPVSAGGLFDTSCFREVSEIRVASGVSAVLVRNAIDDLFFVSKEGNLLPSRLDTTQKNPPISYRTNDDVDVRFLDDSDPYTGIEIDPALYLKGSVEYTFDLGKVYKRDQIEVNIGYVSDQGAQISISLDGINYVPVSESDIENFDIRYVRLAFTGSKVQKNITRFHTLNFFEKIQTRYSFFSPEATIFIYRGYNCQGQKYQTFLSERPRLPYTEILPVTTYTLDFRPNAEYRDDSDGDSFDNLRDNCPLIANPDQSDRNNDGIGDLCSDDDSDGISGEGDNCPTVPNRDQKDQNANRVGDACEFDTDGDGVGDTIDNAIQIKNPDQKDDDNDRIGDVMDNCNLYNPDQLDLDKNGKGDLCDRDEEFRKTNDADKDGILDSIDNCRKGNNPDQSDSDGDGIGDACDNCRELKNTDQSDTNSNAVGDSCEDVDMDGIVGWRDNCPLRSNSDQKDSDNNTIGDVCSDLDGDKLYDSEDTCPIIYNPDQNDIDTDGIGDVCDTKDNRFLESNKYIFMILIGFFGIAFIVGIVLLIRKLQ